ncbi:MAG: hypothetical protein DMD83_09095 [Candidatus Rokuibacteriota bacterium]|nr:MAG: hypothetical protein DMD83_09095 [Candidatus Rokubacteria bacterium]
MQASRSLRHARHGLGEPGDLERAGELVLVQHGEQHQHLVAARHGRGLELVEEAGGAGGWRGVRSHLDQRGLRGIKIACAFPSSPTSRNRRGIDRTDWIPIDRATYDACLDRWDYRRPDTSGS